MGIAAEGISSNASEKVDAHLALHEAQRLSLERGCNAWARALLNEMEVAGAVDRALDRLLEATGRDRLVLFQVHLDNISGDLVIGRVAEAARGGMAQVAQGPAAGPLPAMLATELAAGRAFIADKDAWSDKLMPHRRFAPPGTLLVVPIHAFGRLWGGLWFETAACAPWDADAIHTMGTAADLFAAYLERKQAILARTERNKLAGALEMAGAVCHKLNQPMQIILGYSSMVTSGDISDPEQVREIVQLIEDETRRMGIITKNLMGITRYRTVTDPEGGKIYDIDAPEPSI